MSGYYLLYNGEFAYNKSYSVGYDFGSIKRLDRYPMGALSTLYICFGLKKYNTDFMKVYFDSLKWYKEIYMIAAEGARNHGLLNVPTDEFFDTRHVLPTSEAEQSKIAIFFNLLEARIEKQQRLVTALKSYKRGVSNAIFAHSVGFHHEGESETSTWRVMPFGEVFDFLNSNTLSRADLNYSSGEVKNIHYGDILTKYGAIIDPCSSTVPYINTDAPLSYHKLDYLKTGDIVIADTAEDLTAGKVTEIACANEAKCVSGLHTVACRPRQRFASGYLGHYLNSDYYHRQLLPLIQGTKVSSIARSALVGTHIAFPCLSEQIKVSKCLSLIDTRVEIEERNLDRLVECRKSLLQKLFV